MSIFLRERWLDERLIFNDTLNLTRLELDFSLHGQVWVPDMYILNEKSSDFHEVTVPNRLIHVYPDGSVQLSMRYVIILLLFLLLIHPFNHASFILLLHRILFTLLMIPVSTIAFVVVVVIIIILTITASSLSWWTSAATEILSTTSVFIGNLKLHID